MKRILILALLLSTSAWSQEYADEQYPEIEPGMEREEFDIPHGFPASDYEDIPREEQEYIPEEELVEELPPEEIYENDEQYLE